jgi:hypothetical protein
MVAQERASVFKPIGSITSLWRERSFTWCTVDKYHYGAADREKLEPAAVVMLYMQDKVFHRSFCGPDHDRQVGVHGPFDCDSLTDFGVSAYQFLSQSDFRSYLAELLTKNFGCATQLNDLERLQLSNAQQVFDGLCTSLNSSVFMLRTDLPSMLKHESAFIFDFFVEFLLIDCVNRALQVIVIGAD